MKNFDLKMVKFVVIMVSICIAFAVVVMEAYQYLPADTPYTDSEEEVIEEVNEPTMFERKDEEPRIDKLQDEQEEFVEVEEDRKQDEDKFIERSYNEDFQNESTDFDSLLKKADILKEQAMYEDAIANYKKAIEVTDEKGKAVCYEQMANIYAIQKRYGTALSFAQKAFNIYPSTEREILLARLYYKTGNIDKATNRVNQVLKRDFEQDR